LTACRAAADRAWISSRNSFGNFADRDLIERHGLDPAATRASIMAMLEEQPLPLRGRYPQM
jgi:hypothetical protein